MEVSAKDPCPCGSGKKYKHCHRDRDRKKSSGLHFLAFLIPVLVIGVGLMLWARQTRDPSLDRLLPGGSSGTVQAAADQSPLPDGRDPEPWQYDAPKDRHWNPAHGHWHQGEPPPEEERAAAAASPQVQQTSNPDIPNPEPWQYDPKADKHYDPNHGHWHTGQPPPEGQRTTQATVTTDASSNPEIPNPEPWQYDPKTDKHYDPNHRHWHRGRPPQEVGN